MKPIFFGVLTRPPAGWVETVDVATRAEALGFDALLFADAPRKDPWTLLSALSECTSRLRLGELVTCGHELRPSMLAKVSSTADVITGGRVELGLRGPEGVLRESVEIVRAMWTQAETTYDGAHFRVAQAHCDPKPVQRPHPPILIAGDDDETLQLVARYADRSNFGTSPEHFARTCDRLRHHCAEANRNYEEITKTAPVDADADVDAYIGCEGFVLTLTDTTSMERFAERAMAHRAK